EGSPENTFQGPGDLATKVANLPGAAAGSSSQARPLLPQPIVPLPQTAHSHTGPAPIPPPDAPPPSSASAGTAAPPPTSSQQVGPAPLAPLAGRKPRPLPLEDLPPARLVQPRGPQSPAILLSPPVPRSFTPVPAAFELLPPPPARRTSRICSATRSLSANDLRGVGAGPEEGRGRKGGGASFDVGRLEAALLGREMEQLFRASGQRIMAEGVTTIASVRGGSLVRSTFSARPNGEAASRKLSTLPQHHMGASSQLYDDLRGDSASALDSASEASDLTDSSASAREKARKKVSKRRRGQPDRWPRLLVLSVEAGTVVECQLESSKGKTVTFKFDIHDMFPRDIANNLVVTNLLAEQHADVFVEQVQDIVQQLKEHPDRLPTVSHHLVISDGVSARFVVESMDESSEPPGSSHGSPVRQLPPLPTPHTGPAAPSAVVTSASALHPAPATPTTTTASSVPIAVVQPPTPVTKSTAGGNNQVTGAETANSSSSSSRLASPSATGDERAPLASVANAQAPLPPHAAVAAAVATGAATGLATTGLAVSVLPAVGGATPGGSQAPTPPTYGTTPHALSSENSFSESEPGSSAMPPQAYGVVMDLSHLQQKLVELTTTTTTSGAATHATVTVPAGTPVAAVATPAATEHPATVPPVPEHPASLTPPSPKHPATTATPVPVMAAAILTTAVAATTTTTTTVATAPVAGSGSRPSSVPPEPRKPAVATNLEDLKLELQKLHGNTMKSNIEQGLQAIFSQNAVSSTQPQAPLTPAHSQPQVLPVATPTAPAATTHSAGQISAEGGTHIPLATVAAAPCTNLPVLAPVAPVPATPEPASKSVGSPDGAVPSTATTAATPGAGNRFSRFHVTPVRDDPLLSNPSSQSSSSTTTQSTPTSSNAIVPPPPTLAPPTDAPTPPTVATTATSPIPLSLAPGVGRSSDAEVPRGSGCVVSTATQTSSTEVKASPPSTVSPPVNCGRFKVTTVQEQLVPPPPLPSASQNPFREPPPMMRGRSATLHSGGGGGEARPHCGGEDGAAYQDADPYATFPYADPRKQRVEPSSLELALAKIMRGYLQASSDDLSSLSQTSLDSEPLRVRVHVRDAEAQTERPSMRNACVSTTALPSPSSRRLLASLEPPTLSKARSLSSLSHWREEVGCERCASPSPPCLSPCGSPPSRRSHMRPGSSNLVDWGRSLSLSQFLSALTAEQRQELEAEDSEDAEEFLKQLLARQQREREDLENRHRRELELVRQRLRSAGAPVWPPCELTANGGGSPPQRTVPHSQSVPHFPRAPAPSDWHAPPPPTEPLRINLHRSTSEGPEPNVVGRPLHRTRTLTDDLLRLVQLNGAARTCPGPASPEGKPTLHQLMQQRSLRDGAT
ncbi:unnamed protein product, partial [Ixodes hexagonus]